MLKLRIPHGMTFSKGSKAVQTFTFPSDIHDFTFLIEWNQRTKAKRSDSLSKSKKFLLNFKKLKVKVEPSLQFFSNLFPLMKVVFRNLSSNHFSYLSPSICYFVEPWTLLSWRENFFPRKKTAKAGFKRKICLLSNFN